MKKYLLPRDGQFYKANLHCHSTVSDGKLPPEIVKKVYKANGYSVVAFTDHDLMLPHPELKDEEFLPLTGYEMEFTEPTPLPGRSKRTAHICLISPTESDTKQVCWHREKYLFGNAPYYKDRAMFDESLPDFEREYSVECVNKAIALAKESGFFVTYNHPVWSREHIEDIVRYEGMDAMEIANYSCLVGGYEDYVPWVYEEMYRHGKDKLYVVAADDNHNVHPLGHARFDSCGAWVMIKAESLTYENIFASLKRGDFYASRGPEIKELYVEDGKLYVSCSDAFSIKVHCPLRKGRSIYNYTKAGDVINSAVIPITKDDGRIRVTVTDMRGNTADTRYYSVDELLD